MLFSLVDYTLSRLLWLIVSAGILIYCANLTWRTYGGPERLRWVAILVAFTLGPTYLLLRQGQLTGLVLLGVVGFLHQVEMRSNDWLAGAFAAMVSIKPQLFFLFWLALVFWVIHRRRWKIVLGMVLTLGVLSLIGLAPNRSLIAQYVPTVLGYMPTGWFTPTVGGYLRLLFGPEKVWLQFAAPAIGILWFLFYWRSHCRDWRWSAELPSLVFVSLLTMSYGWTYDSVLLYAALIPRAGALIRTRSRHHIALFASAYFAVNMMYLGAQHRVEDGHLAWLLPVLGIVYLLAGKASQDDPNLHHSTV
jgi:hypothetical protein